MNILSYIVLKIIVILTSCMWSFGKCARSTKKKPSITSTQSYIEEDTKLEEKYERPTWDKDFPKILPPPVRIPEKENKEVDVELDMMQMNVSKYDDKNSPMENGKTPKDDVRPSEILDPVLDKQTHDIRASHLDSKEHQLKNSLLPSKESSKCKSSKEDGKSKENSAKKDVNLTSTSEKKRESNRRDVDKEMARRRKNSRNSSQSTKSRNNSEVRRNGKSRK